MLFAVQNGFSPCLAEFLDDGTRIAVGTTPSETLVQLADTISADYAHAPGS